MGYFTVSLSLSRSLYSRTHDDHIKRARAARIETIYWRDAIDRLSLRPRAAQTSKPNDPTTCFARGGALQAKRCKTHQSRAPPRPPRRSRRARAWALRAESAVWRNITRQQQHTQTHTLLSFAVSKQRSVQKCSGDCIYGCVYLLWAFTEKIYKRALDLDAIVYACAVLTRTAKYRYNIAKYTRKRKLLGFRFVLNQTCQLHLIHVTINQKSHPGHYTKDTNHNRFRETETRKHQHKRQMHNQDNNVRQQAVFPRKNPHLNERRKAQTLYIITGA